MIIKLTKDDILKIDKFEFSSKGKSLIKMYEDMAKYGYDRTDNLTVENAFSDFELRAYRYDIKNIFSQYNIKTILDYGCGGSNWTQKGFDQESNLSADEFFNVKSFMYEPARNIDDRQFVDCVISFDVLEHIFISDIPNVIREMFSMAKELLVLNVACLLSSGR